MMIAAAAALFLPAPSARQEEKAGDRERAGINAGRAGAPPAAATRAPAERLQG
jgi:hypothetical protein